MERDKQKRSTRFRNFAKHGKEYHTYLRSKILRLMEQQPYTAKDVCKLLNISLNYFKTDLCMDEEFRKEAALLHRRNREHQKLFGKPYVFRTGSDYDMDEGDIRVVDEDYSKPDVLED